MRLDCAMGATLIQHLLAESASGGPTRPCSFHKGVRTTTADRGRLESAPPAACATSGSSAATAWGCSCPTRGAMSSPITPAQGRGRGGPVHQATDARSLRKLLGDCEAVGLTRRTGHGRESGRPARSFPDLRWVILPIRSCARCRPAVRRAARDTQPPCPPCARRAESAAAACSADPDPKQFSIDLDRATIIIPPVSTGRPRGAILSHLNVIANTRSILAYLQLTAEDRVLQVSPSRCSTANRSSTPTWPAAVRSSCTTASPSPTTVLDLMEKEEATSFAGVPATFRDPAQSL